MSMIDLSHPITSSMPTYPTDPNILIKQEKNIELDRTLLHSFQMGTHTGTHLDVPAHILQNGKTIGDFPISQFAGFAIMVDNHSIEKLEQVQNEIDGVIYNTGWYKQFNKPEIFFGSARPPIPKVLIQKVIELNVKFFGCDLPSVDRSGSIDKPVHHAFLERDIIIYECLANLDHIPPMTKFQFTGLPLSFESLDGSPVRAGAMI